MAKGKIFFVGKTFLKISVCLRIKQNENRHLKGVLLLYNCPKCGNEMKKELTLEEIFKDYDGEYTAEDFEFYIDTPISNIFYHPVLRKDTKNDIVCL